MLLKTTKTLHLFGVSIGIFLYLVFVLGPAEQFLIDPDSGTQLALAQQILNGKHPFAEVDGGVYGPLCFYPLALLAGLFNGKLIAFAGLLVMGYMFGYLIFYIMFLAVSNSKLLSLCLVAGMLLMHPPLYKYYIVLGPAVVVWAWYYYLQEKPRGVLVVSLAVTFCGLYRLDFGCYAFISSLVLFLLKENNKKIWGQQAISLCVLGAVYCLPWISFIYFKGGQESILSMIHTVQSLSSQLSLPLPAFNLNTSLWTYGNRFYLLFIIFLTLPLAVFIRLFFIYREGDRDKFAWFSALLTFYIFSLPQFFHRSDYSHLKQIAPLGFLLIASLFLPNDVGRTWSLKKYIALVVSGLIIILSLGMPRRLHMNPDNYFQTVPELLHETQSSMTPKLIRNYSLLAKTINSSTNKDETILVIPFAPQLYYFSERHFAMKKGWFYPGVFADKNHEKRFVDMLKNEPPKLIVIFEKFMFDRDVKRHASIYMPNVLKFIYDHYSLDQKIGTASIFRVNTVN